MEDEMLNPLLDSNTKKELKLLIDDTDQFTMLLSKFESDINSREISQVENLSELVNKLKNLRSQMEKIVSKIQYIKNFIKDETSQKSTLVKLKGVSEEIRRKFENLNKKFNAKVETAKNQIKTEIEEKTNSSEDNFNKQNIRVQTVQTIDSRTRMDIDRLRERQEELEKITKISHQLLRISQDMKMSSDRQGIIVDSIESNLVISNKNTNEGLQQLNKRRETESFSIRFYFWICTTLCLVLALVILFLYLKYWRTETN
jgi:t-SNARE complex subunit (syntaxin)